MIKAKEICKCIKTLSVFDVDIPRFYEFVVLVIQLLEST